MNNIYLVGFMGTGKTVVGKELALRLKRKFIDLDGLIEESQHSQIKDIFKNSGEPFFRSLENKFLKQVSSDAELVIACGGGIVLNEENIQLMKNTGVMVCLKASPEVILKRTEKTGERPLLNVQDPKKKIKEFLLARKNFYDRADYYIDTSGGSIVEIVDQIIKITDNK